MSTGFRILYIIESLILGGGAEQALVNLIPVMQAHGYECEVAVLTGPYELADALEKQGVIIHRLDIKNRWNLINGVSRISEIINSGQYDIIHSHLFFAEMYLGLSRFFTKKVLRVATLHNVVYDLYPATTTKKKLIKRFHSFVLRKFIDKYIAVSKGVARHFEKHLKLKNIEVIYNPIPIHKIDKFDENSRLSILSKYKLNPNDFILIMPARLINQKGHKYMLQALKILKESGECPRLLIIGEGPLEKEIIGNISELNLYDQVNIFKKMNHTELFPLIKASDVFVMSSIGEGFPLAPAEAMVLEVPVIATNVSGVPELIEDGVSGLLIQPKDPAALAHAIKKMKDDVQLRRKLGTAGKNRITEHFSVEIIASDLIKYYERIMNY